jgi:hypothetical protein
MSEGGGDLRVEIPFAYIFFCRSRKFSKLFHTIFLSLWNENIPFELLLRCVSLLF